MSYVKIFWFMVWLIIMIMVLVWFLFVNIWFDLFETDDNFGSIIVIIWWLFDEYPFPDIVSDFWCHTIIFLLFNNYLFSFIRDYLMMIWFPHQQQLGRQASFLKSSTLNRTALWHIFGDGTGSSLSQSMWAYHHDDFSLLLRRLGVAAGATRHL